jgi:hypothetical protein
VKSGKKLVWDKGVLIPVAKPAVFVENLSFVNLIENNSNISYTAWKRSSDVIKPSTSKAGALTILTGPKTHPYFENTAYAISQVSRMFPSKDEAKEILWIRYAFSDLKWAESTAKEKLSGADYDQISRNQGGSLAGSNCDIGSGNCRGSYQQTGPSGIALIMQGVENPPTSDPLRMTTGLVEAHEYFHSLQRIPIMNKGISVWPHAWWREGGAEWVQNAAINFNNYASYKKFTKDDCAWSCASLSESEIAEFLKTAKDNYLPSSFDQFLNYTLGSHVIEILVAIKGPDVLIDMYAEMGRGQSFDDSFKNLFGTSWDDAIPVLAKSIYKDLHS